MIDLFPAAIQNAQVVLLALVLITAGMAKLAVPGRTPAGRTPSIALGLAEGGLGVALLVTPQLLVRVATAATFAAATWVISELRNRRPDAGCGCFGGLSMHRVGRRGLVRAALLTTAALVALGAPHGGLDALRHGSGQVALLLVAELALFTVLSPEPAVLVRRLRRRPTPCDQRRSPLSETYETLYDSEAWVRHEDILSSAVPLDVWRERCWRFLVFPARLDDQEIEVVFAVSTGERNRTVRFALLEPNTTVPDFESEDTGPNPRYAMAR